MAALILISQTDLQIPSIPLILGAFIGVGLPTDPSKNPAVTAYIALGSNLGDREKNIRAALRALAEGRANEVTKVSSFLPNPAVSGPPGAPEFLNAAAEIRTSLSPESLLNCLLDIERQLGRVRRQKWEPRIIDLDLLLYGDQIIDTPQLKVPHPLMHQRSFVLLPLSEIAPAAVHPVLSLSVRELVRSLQTT